MRLRFAALLVSVWLLPAATGPALAKDPVGARAPQCGLVCPPDKRLNPANCTCSDKAPPPCGLVCPPGQELSGYCSCEPIFNPLKPKR